MNGDLQWLVCPVGTGGLAGGLAQYFKSTLPGCRIMAVDAHGSVVLNGPAGPRRQIGIGSNRRSDHLDLSLLDELVYVSDDEAFAAAVGLAREESLCLGCSSGSAIAGLLKRLSRTNPGDRIVVISADSGMKYLDTIYNPQWTGTLANALLAARAGRAGGPGLDVPTQAAVQTTSFGPLLESGELLYLNGRDVESLGVFDFAANRASVMEAYRAHWAGDVRMPGSDYLKYEGRPELRPRHQPARDTWEGRPGQRIETDLQRRRQSCPRAATRLRAHHADRQLRHSGRFAYSRRRESARLEPPPSPPWPWLASRRRRFGSPLCSAADIRRASICV